MNTGKKYKTKQKEVITECIRENNNAYITIKELSHELEERGSKVGLTTIYRNLDKLEQEGIIGKVSIEGISGTCYCYLPQKEQSIMFYLKCERCGKLVNIDCPELAHLYGHLSKEHRIYINPGKTMFYGICEGCMDKETYINGNICIDKKICIDKNVCTHKEV